MVMVTDDHISYHHLHHCGAKNILKLSDESIEVKNEYAFVYAPLDQVMNYSFGHCNTFPSGRLGGD